MIKSANLEGARVVDAHWQRQDLLRRGGELDRRCRGGSRHVLKDTVEMNSLCHGMKGFGKCFRPC